MPGSDPRKSLALQPTFQPASAGFAWQALQCENPILDTFVRWNALECARVGHKSGHKLTWKKILSRATC